MENIRFGAIHGRLAQLTTDFNQAASVIRDEPDANLKDNAQVDLAILRGSLESLRFRANQSVSLTAEGFESVGKEFSELELALKDFCQYYITESARQRNMVQEQIKYQDHNRPFKLKRPRGSHVRSASASQQSGSSTLGQSSSRHSSMQYGGGTMVHGGSGLPPTQHLPAVHSSHIPERQMPSLHHPYGGAYPPGFNQSPGFPQARSSDVIVYPPAMNFQPQQSGFGPYGSRSSQHNLSAPQGYSFPAQGQMGAGQNPGLQGPPASRQRHSSSHTRNSSSTLDDLYDIYGDPQ
ncbi:hypothetical protein Hypma_013005 [Hypsizygus marmoreus]|uniref:Uncharacterized protein n=1 Tax=Hypsizygus marmoreus TaxID=39966 RepID=A0A369JK74_HYPMA|nr:hypothetical protein Hypma_013005 [Hypsizygus marmoreus]